MLKLTYCINSQPEDTVEIQGATAVVTGANRGLGRALAAELIDRGATVWAGARTPGSIDLPGAKPVHIDITDQASVEAAARAAGDATILINNAGSATGADVLDGDWQLLHDELELHYFGTLRVTRQFAPIIERNGGGAVLNILSVLSWLGSQRLGGYAVAKSAEWSMTNSLRLQLAPRGISVAGLHVGFMETAMARGFAGPKTSPEEVARLAIDGLEAESPEIVIDERSRAVQATLSDGVPALYPTLAKL
jgi:NAD(P)-dependent dehydrogenase (short-subunit alcohol dehydrogenase family)